MSCLRRNASRSKGDDVGGIIFLEHIDNTNRDNETANPALALIKELMRMGENESRRFTVLSAQPQYIPGSDVPAAVLYANPIHRFQAVLNSAVNASLEGQRSVMLIPNSKEWASKTLNATSLAFQNNRIVPTVFVSDQQISSLPADIFVGYLRPKRAAKEIMEALRKAETNPLMHAVMRVSAENKMKMLQNPRGSNFLLEAAATGNTSNNSTVPSVYSQLTSIGETEKSAILAKKNSPKLLSMFPTLKYLVDETVFAVNNTPINSTLAYNNTKPYPFASFDTLRVTQRNGTNWVDPFKFTLPSDSNLKNLSVDWVAPNTVEGWEDAKISVFSNYDVPDGEYRVRNGGLGDSMLYNAMGVTSLLGRQQELISRMDVDRGLFEVKLYSLEKDEKGLNSYSKKFYTTVDNLVPVASAKGCEAGKVPCYLYSLVAGEIWPVIVEKAVAKNLKSQIKQAEVVADYEILTSSTTWFSVAQLLGGTPWVCMLKAKEVDSKLLFNDCKAILDGGDCLELIFNFERNKVVGVDANGHDNPLKTKIPYILSRVVEVKSREDTIRLGKFYNPWGKQKIGDENLVWTGPWGPSSNLWVVHPLVFEATQFSESCMSQDHGSFWMPFEDIAMWVENICVTKLLPPSKGYMTVNGARGTPAFKKVEASSFEMCADKCNLDDACKSFNWATPGTTSSDDNFDSSEPRCQLSVVEIPDPEAVKNWKFSVHKWIAKSQNPGCGMKFETAATADEKVKSKNDRSKAQGRHDRIQDGIPGATRNPNLIGSVLDFLPKPLPKLPKNFANSLPSSLSALQEPAASALDILKSCQSPPTHVPGGCRQDLEGCSWLSNSHYGCHWKSPGSSSMTTCSSQQCPSGFECNALPTTTAPTGCKWHSNNEVASNGAQVQTVVPTCGCQDGPDGSEEACTLKGSESYGNHWKQHEDIDGGCKWQNPARLFEMSSRLASSEPPAVSSSPSTSLPFKSEAPTAKDIVAPASQGLQHYTATEYGVFSGDALETMFGSAEECAQACDCTEGCQGFDIDNIDHTCQLSASSQPNFVGNMGYTFYSKN